MTAYLCAAGTTLRDQLDKRWPDRDHASDGWIGDAAHTTGDHVPDASSTPPGVVRAIDVDEDFLGARQGDPFLANRFANQLIACARNGEDGGRLKYVIFEGRIASGTYQSSFWTWRQFDGDPHTTHIHISFTPRGDKRGAPFELPIFYGPKRRWLTRQIKKAQARVRAWRARRKALPA